MADVLAIDAAYPPAPDKLVADMCSLGATAAAVYVWDAAGVPVNWTAAHVGALNAAGFGAIPIVVPGDNPGEVGPMLEAAEGFGFAPGPIVFDFERFSAPSNAWWAAAISTARAGGWSAIRYVNLSNQAGYAGGDGTWLAQYIRFGAPFPVPERPPGCVAWQYTNEVNLGGNAYDVSIADPEIVGGANPYQHSAGGPGMLFVFNGTLHRVYIAADGSIRHRFSPPGFADAAAAIVDVQPGAEEVIPPPPGVSPAPWSLAITPLGPAWNIEVIDAHTGEGWIRVESNTTGQPMRDWTKIVDDPAALEAAPPPSTPVDEHQLAAEVQADIAHELSEPPDEAVNASPVGESAPPEPPPA